MLLLDKALSVKLFRCSHEHACWHTHTHICTNIVVVNRAFTAQVTIGNIPCTFALFLHFYTEYVSVLMHDVHNKCEQCERVTRIPVN